MKVEFEWIEANDAPPVVILGSGPAGFALAMQLSAQGVDSLVLEAGGEAADDESQEFYRGRVIGDPYFELDEARLRGYGGTSGHWTGRGRPMETWDFEAKPWMPRSGWPFGKEELDPYEDAAYALLQIPRPEDAPLGHGLFFAGRPGGAAPMFGYDYDDFFEDDPRARICFETAVEWLEAKEGRIEALHLRTMDGRSGVIRPKAVVIAAGGIETSRILLWSNIRSAQKAVPHDELLGRCWMEHPTMYVGAVEVDDAFMAHVGTGGMPKPIAPTFEMMQRHEIANGTLHVYATPEGGGMKDQAMRAMCRMPVIGGRVAALTGKSLRCRAGVIADIEQAPDPANRVALSETERDAFGVPRVELHWRRTAQDYRTAKVLFELLGRHLALSGTGRAMASDYVIEEGGYPDAVLGAGWHHMGGCRMSASANEGVVDPDLKIHGIANAWVLGSAVYPNAGYTNPTLAIVQLAMRLGDRLAARSG